MSGIVVELILPRSPILKPKSIIDLYIAAKIIRFRENCNYRFAIPCEMALGLPCRPPPSCKKCTPNPTVARIQPIVIVILFYFCPAAHCPI